MKNPTSPIGLCTFIIMAALLAAGCAMEVAQDASQQDDDEGEAGVVSQALMQGSHAYTFYMKDAPLNEQDFHFTYTSNDIIPTFSSAGTGRVTVHFIDLPGTYGNVQVSAVGSDSARCKVEGWRVSSGDRLVDVRCHNHAGTLTNSDFVVYYATAVTGGYGGAYLLNNNPSSLLNVTYNAPVGYNYNSEGSANRITRVGTGVYDNRLPGNGLNEGTNHVTAYGTGSEYCNVASSTASGNDRIVRVRCFNTNGQPTNTSYSLDYKPLGGQGLGGTGASAIANSPTTSSYRPSSWYNSGACQPVARDARATRAATGKYNMRFDAMAAEGAGIVLSVALVSGYGASAGYCKIGRDPAIDVPQWWLPTGDAWTDVEIGVRCYNNSGNLIDHEYVTSFITPWVAGYCDPIVML